MNTNTTPTPKNFVEVQKLLDLIANLSPAPIAGAPHGDFWNTMTYGEFIKKDVPNVNPKFLILVVGDSKSSNIIQILRGTGKAFDIFGQMPRPNAPYPKQKELVDALACWIDNKCPNNP